MPISHISYIHICVRMVCHIYIMRSHIYISIDIVDKTCISIEICIYVQVYGYIYITDPVGVCILHASH